MVPPIENISLVDMKHQNSFVNYHVNPKKYGTYERNKNKISSIYIKWYKIISFAIASF